MKKFRPIFVSGILLTLILLLTACAGGNSQQVGLTDVPDPTPPSVATEPVATPEPTPTPATPAESTPTAQPTPQAPSQPAATQAGEISFEITNTQEHFFEHRANEFTYQSLIQITNTGEIPIYFGTSRFDLTDENDRILSANNTFSARPTILHPGERGYLWANERITGATASTEVTLVPRFDMSRSIHYRPDFELTDIEIRDNPNRFIDNLIVVGRITNNTDSEISRADITVVLYAHDGTPIGVWTTTARDLPAGASFGFEATSSNTIFENLTSAMVGEFTAFAVDFWQRNR